MQVLKDFDIDPEKQKNWSLLATCLYSIFKSNLPRCPANNNKVQAGKYSKIMNYEKIVEILINKHILILLGVISETRK